MILFVDFLNRKAFNLDGSENEDFVDGIFGVLGNRKSPVAVTHLGDDVANLTTQVLEQYPRIAKYSDQVAKKAKNKVEGENND